ncbi:mechanosensitive ion channel protein [Candidatus Campbellbacteria bacterium]|nr:mechanosensitive ion channel protein [Candidatus Campbellbacteria bacterium]|tara:strand:+ start:2171 stop:2995 length:825 start_codon:yes stop_codon:yes gene_type:complete
MEQETVQTYYDQAIAFLFDYGPRVIGAIVLIVGGLWLIRQIIKLLKKAVRARHLDRIVETFILRLVAWALRILLFVTVLSQLGIVTTSMAAILGAVGLAIGLSLQGSLSNFAGGVIIFLFKPFKSGDLIEAQGVTGFVQDIQIFQTCLLGVQNKIHIIPNGKLSNDVITNYSKEGKIRSDVSIGIGYAAPIDVARDILIEVMEKHDKVMSDPKPQVRVTELGDSAVVIRMEPWTTAESYYAVRFDLYEAAKRRLDEAGIDIPFPQRVVHMQKDD